jgi:hypothetical protein
MIAPLAAVHPGNPSCSAECTFARENQDISYSGAQHAET